MTSAASGSLNLRGPHDWSANDVAAAFSGVLGRPVETAFVPPEARAAALAQEGVPPEVSDALLGMYDGIASGRVEHEEGTEQRRGSVALADAVERIVRRMERMLAVGLPEAALPQKIADEVSREAVAYEEQEEFILRKIRAGRPIYGTYPLEDEGLAEYAAERAAHDKG